ncbi:MAG TPA: 4-alpha-glucanotransferase [Candidatus Binatia bacterium]|nr:4-alpha-glucanotransferase [Candidatus Binatia bacterium]
MNADIQSRRMLPFPENYRASGLLLHLTSLPSPYGIGDVGPTAVKWIDKLSETGQSWWQALPLGPTGYGDSPYQCLSSFAGNGLLISPDLLIEDGLLRASEAASASFSESAVDYPAVISFKRRLLAQAWVNFQIVRRSDLRVGFEQFCNEQAHWLEDYALFRALKEKHNGAWYVDWPADLVRREPAALNRARRVLRSEMKQVCFAQFLLFRQGEHLMRYGKARGVRLIGDLPFFVSPDSSDVWANPELFLLDEHRRPIFVAGVPPDYFSSEGQLWGNPVYNWEVLRQSGYRWCINRFRALLAFVDVIRLDHFRAFSAAWHIPAGATSAKTGEWVPGPGADFFNVVKKELGGLPFIAEDLGIITPDVSKLRDDFDIPGTRVLQFAFDGQPENPYLPENFVPNTVVYTGTHDNPTSREWYEALPATDRKNLWRYLNSPEHEAAKISWELLRLAWFSRAALAMAPLQDLLNLGAEARINVPGRRDGNWRWRCTKEMLSAADFSSLRDLTKSANRMASYQSADDSICGAAL